MTLSAFRNVCREEFHDAETAQCLGFGSACLSTGSATPFSVARIDFSDGLRSICLDVGIPYLLMQLLHANLFLLICGSDSGFWRGFFLHNEWQVRIILPIRHKATRDKHFSVLKDYIA